MSALHLRVIRGTAAALLLGAVLAAAAALPAAARLDAGSAPERAGSVSCPLERVGTQFVRCDDLTGNGEAAPQWIPQR